MAKKPQGLVAVTRLPFDRPALDLLTIAPVIVVIALELGFVLL
jgi:hypothetical protein